MAGRIRLDLRRVLRAIGRAIQDENARRLLAGVAVDGGALAPRATGEVSRRGRAAVRLVSRRIGFAGEADAGRLGVRSGALLRDLTRRSNIRVTRTSVRVVPSPDVRARHFALSAGTGRQVERPFSGMSADAVARGAEEVAREGREQLVRGMQRVMGRLA